MGLSVGSLDLGLEDVVLGGIKFFTSWTSRDLALCLRRYIFEVIGDHLLDFASDFAVKVDFFSLGLLLL